MNILLTTPRAPSGSPFYLDEKRPPLGIGFLISVLKNAGHTVFFIDNYLKPSNFFETDYLIKNRIDYVGIYTSTICWQETLVMLERIEKMRKEAKWNGKIILGGPHTSVALETIPLFVDYIVQGEGERAIIQILNGHAERIIKLERIKVLDSLPMPSWEYFARLPYNYRVPWFKERPVYTMNTSRGCPYSCSFCSVSSIWGRTYTYFSASRMVDDIKYLINTYGIKGIYFREDNFTLDKNRVIAFCEALLKDNIKIKWACESRINPLDYDLIKLMYNAGCRAYYLGVENGSQRLLDLMKKDITIDQIEKVFKWCREIGMKTAASFIVGIPSEEEKDLLETISFAKRIRPTTTWFNIFVGIPKSELYEYVLQNHLYEYIDACGLVYLKGHNRLVDIFFRGDASKKISKQK